MINITSNYIKKICKADGGAFELFGGIVLFEVEKVHDGTGDS